MKENLIKELFASLEDLSGTAMGAVLAILAAMTLAVADMLALELGMLALAWMLVALIFLVGMAAAAARRNTAERGLLSTE